MTKRPEPVIGRIRELSGLDCFNSQRRPGLCGVSLVRAPPQILTAERQQTPRQREHKAPIGYGEIA